MVAHLTFGVPTTAASAQAVWQRWIREVACIAGAVAGESPHVSWLCVVEWARGKDRPHIHALLSARGVGRLRASTLVRRWEASGGGRNSRVEPVHDSERLTSYLTKWAGRGASFFDVSAR